MKSLLHRGLIASLFVLAGVSALASDYKLYYCYKDQKWMCYDSKQKQLSDVPTFNRGDHIKLYVIQNTLKTEVKIKVDQKLFGSDKPEILTTLFDGIEKSGIKALADPDTSKLKALENLANLYPVVVELLRSKTPNCTNQLDDSTLLEIKTLIVSAFESGRDTNDPSSKVMTHAVNSSTPLSAIIKIIALAGLKVRSVGDSSKLFDQVSKLADIVEVVENHKLFQSGPYEINPDSDLLTIQMTFAAISAPDWTVLGSQGDDDKKNSSKKAVTPASSDDSNVPSADTFVERNFFLGSRGFGFARPSYTIGYANSSLVDVSYRKVTNGSATTVEPGAKNSWKVVPTALMHLNIYSTPDFHAGPTLGVLYSGKDLVSYFGGLSFQFGRKTRLSLNLGFQFGQVDVLDGIQFGDTITDGQVLTRKVWRNKSVLGISYSF